ncbi:MAG: DAK2 domain-containing protein [Clostridia bacterium]|nr:DAK2 domain-containing protein [Clostridia bacterium]
MDIRNQKAIDGKEFFSLIAAGVANLNKNLKTVNELNVFPIPDGDTGDNMYHTISGGFERIRSIEQNDVGKRARALADGMLLNARGNSGVILSQLFAGLADGLDGKTTATVSDLAAAFNEGVKTAYLSVIKPVEGTILTVARESFGRGAETLKEDSDLGQYFTEVLKEMKVSLENTPNLLAVLKEAGVIDSGGAGLYYIADGMKRALSGEETITETAGRTEPDKNVDFSKFDEDTEMTFGYCTEFLLRLQNRKTDVKNFDEKVIIDYLSTIGDSIVCFKTGSIVKAHVHTFEPYKALEFCRSFGEFLTVKIENMTLQHNETIGGELAVTTAKNERKPFGVVAVATGAGVIEMFKDFGADVVIDGGQGNNPSAETFIKAFDEVNADDIFVLPNNSNIILTAKQAGKMYDNSAVHVIEHFCEEAMGRGVGDAR